MRREEAWVMASGGSGVCSDWLIGILWPEDLGNACFFQKSSDSIYFIPEMCLTVRGGCHGG